MLSDKNIWLIWILYHILHRFNSHPSFIILATASNHLLVGLRSRVLHGTSPENIRFFISIPLGHIVIIFFIDVTTATPTIFICHTIMVYWWQRQTERDIARRNTRTLNPWLFQLYSKLLLNLVLSLITVNDEIMRQGEY